MLKRMVQRKVKEEGAFISLIFIRDGQFYDVKDAAKDAALMKKMPVLFEKTVVIKDDMDVLADLDPSTWATAVAVGTSVAALEST